MTPPRKVEQTLNISGAKAAEREFGEPNPANGTNMELKANIVTVNQEGSVTNIGFADDEYDTRNYLLMSYDREEPHEGLYIEVNGQNLSGYGMVQSVGL